MVTVDEYARIRLGHRDGLSIRQLAQRFHHSRRKIRDILATPEPKSYQRLNPPPSILDPFKPIIDSILTGDEQAPRKQRHTAAKLFRRLRQEFGYSGGYDRVRRHLRSRVERQREVFIPLDHDLGQRLECDFGHIAVDFPEGRRQVPVLVVTWSWSNCPFAIALPTERTEAILHGMSEAFAFFGCVPRQVWWDNPKTVVPHLLVGRSRKIHERYQALASHFRFEPLFCLVRRPQEKPRVEGRVQFLQQDWATPVPQVKDLAELNAHLRACCLRERERTQQGQTEPIGVRFAREQAQALPLPERGFDACIMRPAKVDKYQTVQFDRNRYSVPRAHAFGTVTIKGYVDHIAVVVGAEVVARHQRSYGQHEQILEPLHYLGSLGRRPAALDHANVFRNWQLPPLFGQVRKSLEHWLGPERGTRQYIRILQLLAEHPVERVVRAIELNHRERGYDVEAVLRCARRLAEQGDLGSSQPDWDSVAALPAIQVLMPNLRQFDQLLTTPEMNDERDEPLVGESQPQAIALAGDACRVREIGSGGSHRQSNLRAVFAAFDRAGGNGPRHQRVGGPYQAGSLPGPQGPRHLRLLGHAGGQ
jgi:transposase